MRKKTILLFIVLFFVLLPSPLVAQLQFNPIETFTAPNRTSITEGTTLTQYLATIYDMSIGVAAILAVIMIVVAGFQYTASAGNETSISNARKRIQNAVLGLLLVLGAYVFLYTLNPAFVQNVFCIPPIESNQGLGGCGEENAPRSTVLLPETPSGCPTCVSVGGTGILAKTPNRNGCEITVATPTNGSCQVAESILDNLIQMHENLTSAGINYEVTELWPPTRTHANSCHRRGTCVDLAVRSTQTATNIRDAFIAIQEAGLRPQYEVQNEARKTVLLNSGVFSGIFSEDSIIVVPWATGEHFSVYSN